MDRNETVVCSGDAIEAAVATRATLIEAQGADTERAVDYQVSDSGGRTHGDIHGHAVAIIDHLNVGIDHQPEDASTVVIAFPPMSKMPMEARPEPSANMADGGGSGEQFDVATAVVGNSALEVEAGGGGNAVARELEIGVGIAAAGGVADFQGGPGTDDVGHIIGLAIHFERATRYRSEAVPIATADTQGAGTRLGERPHQWPH